jgi:hypothetical protein
MDLVTEDISKHVEQGKVFKFGGTEIQVEKILGTLLGDKPKYAIVGPSGTGKTQLAMRVAMKFAELEPSTGLEGCPYVRRLLRLDLEGLEQGEELNKGWASQKLSAARAEIERAIGDKGFESQGVIFVILIGGFFLVRYYRCLAHVYRWSQSRFVESCHRASSLFLRLKSTYIGVMYRPPE